MLAVISLQAETWLLRPCPSLSPGSLSGLHARPPWLLQVPSLFNPVQSTEWAPSHSVLRSGGSSRDSFQNSNRCLLCARDLARCYMCMTALTCMQHSREVCASTLL